MRARRPTTAEAAEFYFTYIDKVPDGDVVERLERQMVETRALAPAMKTALSRDPAPRIRSPGTGPGDLGR